MHHKRLARFVARVRAAERKSLRTHTGMKNHEIFHMLGFMMINILRRYKQQKQTTKKAEIIYGMVNKTLFLKLLHPPPPPLFLVRD